MRVLLFSFVFLAGCAALEERDESPAREELILGHWVLYGNSPCWNVSVEYMADGNKEVTMRYCVENGEIQEDWYVANWSISGDRIIEVVYGGSQRLFDKLGVRLPHIENDKLDYLDKNVLVIIDEGQKLIYVRP